ncbi:MAG: hypothetical protein ABWK01_07835 [Infirmifilum sp.]
MFRLKGIEFEVLKSLPSAKDFTDVSRAARISLSSVRRVLQRLSEKFLIRGNFYLEGFGYELLLVEKEFDPALFSRPLPFILEKIPVSTGKNKAVTYLLVLSPRGMREETADILRVDEVLPVRKFVWRPDYSSELTLQKGTLVLGLDSVVKAMESGFIPRLEPTIEQRPDPIDLWIMAEITRDPFVSLSREARKMGIRQQTASYHYTQHVQPFHIFNALTPRFYSYRVAGLFLEVSTSPGMAEQVSWALSTHPMIRETFSLPEDKVYVLTYLQGRELWELFNVLRESDLIADFKVKGALTLKIMEYTPPFGPAFQENPYNLQPLYESIHTPSRSGNWAVYDISEEAPP